MASSSAAVLGQVVRMAARAGAGPVSDRELLRRFAHGDQEAFAQLFRRHVGMVLGVCRRGTATTQDAEDACQAVFLVLARKAGRTEWQASIANWLYTTARNMSRNAAVAAARRARHETKAAVPEATTAADPLSAREMLAALDEEMERLPRHYREPLVLCCLEGLTRDEAAGRLGVPAATLKSHLERGRKKLGEALTRRGVELGAVLLAATAVSSATAGTRLTAGVLEALTGSASPSVAALVQGVRPMILLGKKAAAIVLVLTAGFGLGVVRGRPADQADEAAAALKTAAPAAEKVDAKDKKDAGKVVTASGRVLGPDGKPMAGVKLFVPAAKSDRLLTEDDLAIQRIGETDGEGRFAVRFTMPAVLPRFYLVAYAKGFGIEWVEFEQGAMAKEDLTLRLPKDVPISGRVVSTEGKPVEGVKVTPTGIYVPQDGSLDGYLDGWKRNLRDTLSTPQHRIYLPLEDVTGGVKTDKDGRFSLSGLGEERIVHVLFEGGGIARTKPYVITRKGFDPKPYNDILLRKEHDDLRVLNRFMGLMGPELTFVAEPGKEISGVVTDAATRQPVQGVAISVQTGWGDGTGTATDAQGRYRLTGIPKNIKGYRPMVMPPEKQGYVSPSPNVADTEGYTPLRLDVRLSKGAVVTGQVIDKQTGKGVETGIRFAPLLDNKFFGSKPEYNGYAGNRTTTGTDKEGRFRLVTIPGKSLVLGQVFAREKKDGENYCVYRNAVPDPDYKDLFTPEEDSKSWIVTTAGNSIEFLNNENFAKVIDVKEGSETTVQLFVDRGKTGRIEIQDGDGKPLPGAWVAGVTDHWPITYQLKGATGTIYALDPAQPRTVVVYHPGKKLAGTATVRGDEKEVVAVKLTPTGTVTGRLLDAEKLPLAGVEMSVNPRSGVASELYRFAFASEKPPVTDKDGRFTLPGVVPGLEVYLGIRKGDHYFQGKPAIGMRTLKPGETLDLGDRVVEQVR